MAQSTNVFFSSVPGIHWPAVPTAMGARYLSMLAQFEQSEWWPPERLHTAQLRQIELLLRHAARHVPYYRDRLRDAGFDPAAPLTWESFGRLPLLERADVQTFRYELISQDELAGHGDRIEGSTSGSTGRPIRFQGTSLSGDIHCALSLRDHLWHRRDLAAKHAAIRSKVETRVLNGWGPIVESVFVSGRFVVLDVMEPIETQVRWLRRHNPTYLASFPSNVGALALKFIELGAGVPRLKEILTFGELVPPELAGLCREAWGVPLTNLYSSEELGIIALQCPEHRTYHVQSESVLVEVLHPSGRACEAGEHGRVVITCLHNFAMPLIRYAIGDYAIPAGPCACGRGLPGLERILGRARNLAVLPDGSRRWPSFPAKMWLAIAPIRQFRLVQKSLERVEVQYVCERDLSAAEQNALVRELTRRLGHAFAFGFERRPEIPRGASFKYEDFVCEVTD